MLVNIAGILVFTFLFWKSLREDYASEQIFSTCFLALTGILLGTVVSWKFFPEFWFWIDFGLGLTFLAFGILRYKLRTYESIEAFLISCLPWLALIFLEHAARNVSVSSFFGLVTLVILAFLFVFLNRHYTKFNWYKSGRAGFAGVTTAGVFFLIRALVALFAGSVLSFIGSLEVFVSGVASFLCFLILFNLSRYGK